MLPLTTFSEIATALNLTKDEEEYPEITSLQESVYAAFESYLGRSLELDEYTDAGYLYGEQTFALRAMPIVSLSAVVVAGQDVTAQCEARLGDVVLPTCFIGTISVTYEGGLEDAPPALKRAAFIQTIHEFQRKSRMGATSETTDGGTVTWPELGLLKEVRRLLDPFTHPARLI